MNDLYTEFDSKLSKMLVNKSLILAYGNGTPGGVGNWNDFPFYSYLGQPFFFITGAIQYCNKIPLYSALSYDPGPFNDAAANAVVASLDTGNGIVQIDNIHTSLGASYYNRINQTAADTISFFDYSLKAHTLSGYYLQEHFESSPGYNLPEKKYNYALADVFAENVTSINWQSDWDKYKCLRFHNFNSTGRLTVNFQETAQSFLIDPLGCQSFRKGANVWSQSPFRYFQQYNSSDPLSYAYWPKGIAYGKITPWGKSSFENRSTPQNSQAANNLLNPSILFNLIDQLSYKNKTNSNLEKLYGSYAQTLNANFFFETNNPGLDITDLYAITSNPTISGDYLIGTTGTHFSASSLYGYSSPVALDSGLSKVDLYTNFPQRTQAVTLDIILGGNTPNSLNLYGSYDASANWRLLDSFYETGWQSGQRSTFYINNNGRFQRYKLSLSNFSNQNLPLTIDGYKFHGFFDNPKDDTSKLGNLFYHRGELVKAKISKTEESTPGIPKCTFENIVFNGLDKLNDWSGKHLIASTRNANGNLVLSNIDPDNYVDLIPVSTNLLKLGAFDYSAVNGGMPVPLDLGGIELDNHFFENILVNNIQYAGHGNHLNAGNSLQGSVNPPRIFANINIQNSITSGSFRYKTWGHYDFSGWDSGKSYEIGERVSANRQRFYSLTDNNINNNPVHDYPPGDANWAHLEYAEPFDAGNTYYTGFFYAKSGTTFRLDTVGQPFLPTTAVHPITYTGIIDLQSNQSLCGYNWTHVNYVNSGATLTANNSSQYTGLLPADTTTVASLKNPNIYGLVSGISTGTNFSFRYEPEGLCFSCLESFDIGNYPVTIDESTEGSYFNDPGKFNKNGSLYSRTRKCAFRGHGFGYIGNYFTSYNWLGPNATSFFQSPRFPRAYSNLESGTTNHYNLITGDLENQSGQDFSVVRTQSPSISKFSVLHRIDPLINYLGVTSSTDTFKNDAAFNNFFYYKNDHQVENAYYDKNALDYLPGFENAGYFYAATRPQAYPLGQILLPNDAFPAYSERRFYTPLFSEHYNLMAQAVNLVDSAKPLDVEFFTNFSYSGVTFKIVTQNADSPVSDAITWNLFSDISDPSLMPPFYFPPFHANALPLILPRDFFVAFTLTGHYYGDFFPKFFQSINVPVKTIDDFGADFGLLNSSTGVSKAYTYFQTLNYDHNGSDGYVYFLDVNSHAVATGGYAVITGATYTTDVGYTVSGEDFPTDGPWRNYKNNYQNFGWVSKADWKNYLTGIGSNYYIKDNHIPLGIKKYSIDIKTGRYSSLPSPATFIDFDTAPVYNTEVLLNPNAYPYNNYIFVGVSSRWDKWTDPVYSGYDPDYPADFPGIYYTVPGNFTPDIFTGVIAGIGSPGYTGGFTTDFYGHYLYESGDYKSYNININATANASIVADNLDYKLRQYVAATTRLVSPGVNNYYTFGGSPWWLYDFAAADYSNQLTVFSKEFDLNKDYRDYLTNFSPGPGAFSEGYNIYRIDKTHSLSTGNAAFIKYTPSSDYFTDYSQMYESQDNYLAFAAGNPAPPAVWWPAPDKQTRILKSSVYSALSTTESSVIVGPPSSGLWYFEIVNPNVITLN